MARGQPLALTPTLRDLAGALVVGRMVTWTSSDSTVLRVGTNGTLVGASPREHHGDGKHRRRDGERCNHRHRVHLDRAKRQRHLRPDG